MFENVAPLSDVRMGPFVNEDMFKPTKDGAHVWVVATAYIVSGERLADSDRPLILDRENMAALSVRCHTCEQEFSPARAKRECPGDPREALATLLRVLQETERDD